MAVFLQAQRREEVQREFAVFACVGGHGAEWNFLRVRGNAAGVGAVDFGFAGFSAMNDAHELGARYYMLFS